MECDVCQTDVSDEKIKKKKLKIKSKMYVKVASLQ